MKTPAKRASATSGLLTTKQLIAAQTAMTFNPAQDEARFLRTAYYLNRAQIRPVWDPSQTQYLTSSVKQFNLTKFQFVAAPKQPPDQKLFKVTYSNVNKPRKTYYSLGKAKPTKVVYLKEEGLQLQLGQRWAAVCHLQDKTTFKQLLYFFVPVATGAKDVSQDLQHKKRLSSLIKSVFRWKETPYLFGVDARPICFVSELGNDQVFLAEKYPRINFQAKHFKSIFRIQNLGLEREVALRNAAVPKHVRSEFHKKYAESLLKGNFPDITEEARMAQVLRARQKRTKSLIERKPPQYRKFDEEEKQKLRFFEEAVTGEAQDLPSKDLRVLILMNNVAEHKRKEQGKREQLRESSKVKR